MIKKSKVATYELTTPINVLINASKVLKNLDKKKEIENDLLPRMALQIVPIAIH